MDLLLTTIFFALLFLLLGVTHRAGLTILFWSLLIFVIVAGIFVFYQYVRDYERIHGVGSWTFDPFALMRRSRITRVGGLRAEDLRRLRRIMRDLDYTNEEIDAYIALLEERGDVDLNEVLILDDEIQGLIALQADGKLPSAEKTRLLQKFKDGLVGISGNEGIKQAPAVDASPSATTTPTATTAAAPAPTAPAPAPVTTCDARSLRGSQQLADIDYQLFRPRRDPTLKAGCSKCVLDEFDSLSPKSLIPNTVAEYTQMLLGEKRSTIDSIVSKVQTKCFPNATGRDKAKTIKVLTEMFSVYFFAHAQPELPAHTRKYLKSLDTKPSLLVSYHKDVGGGRCRMNAAAMKERQDNLTDAVYALYATYRLAVMGTDAASAVGSSGSSLSELFDSTSPAAPKASSSYEDSTLTSPLDYKPLSESRSTPSTDTSEFLTTTQLNFTEEDLKEHINAILAGSDEKCSACVQELITAMQYEMTEQRFLDQMRVLRHTPTKKTTFMVQFLMVYFKHFADYCVDKDEKEEANINLHMYARKFLALTQLFWAVILQTAAKRADRSSTKSSSMSSSCRTASLSDMYNFFYDEYYADPQALSAYDRAYFGY